jgi:hypothetical protein
MRLRQIALVGADLDANKADIEAVLGLGESYLDPGVAKYGLVNAVWPIGETFLEVVSPFQEGTTARRLLEKRGGDGGYMAIFQVEDIEVARARAAAAGVRSVNEYNFDNVRISHLHPRDIGGAIVSIDWMDPWEHWEWGGPHWRTNARTDVSLAITGCELQADDPEAMAARWSAALGPPHQALHDGVFAMVMEDGGQVRFVPVGDGRGEGLSAFDVKVRDPAAVYAQAETRGLVDNAGAVVLCGTRVNLIVA